MNTIMPTDQIIKVIQAIEARQPVQEKGCGHWYDINTTPFEAIKHMAAGCILRVKPEPFDEWWITACFLDSASAEASKPLARSAWDAAIKWKASQA